MTSRLAGETILAANYDADIDLGPNGILAWGQRTTSSSTTTTTVGVLRLDDIPMTGGRSYLVLTTPLNIDSTGGPSDDVRVFIKYTADGSTPTTASATLPGSVAGGDLGGGGTGAPTPTISTVLTPTGGDQLSSFLLCVQRVAGAGNSYIFGDATQTIEMYVIDIGKSVVDSGTDI